MTHFNVQGVVNIFSPVKTAFAPAIKHMACSDSFKVFRPAASLMIVVGNTTRAVDMVRTSVWNDTGYKTSNYIMKFTWNIPHCFQAGYQE